MDYSKYIKTKKTAIAVGDKIVEFEGNTWFVKHLVQIWIQKYDVPFELPEPQFDDPKPARQLNLIWAIIVLVSGISVSIFFDTIWIYLLAMLLALSVVITSIRKSKKNISQWEKKKEKHDKRVAAWKKIKDTPITVCSLSIEPNNLPNPLFYSFDVESVEEAVNAIKQSTQESSIEKTIIDFETIDIEDETSIAEFGAKIYQDMYKKS